MVASVAHAKWYVVNQDNEIVLIANYEPSRLDLESRNEISVYSDLDIELQEAEYRNGKIIKHVETQAEKKAKEDKVARVEELKIIRDKSDLMAKKELEKEGIIFKQVKDEDFNSKQVKDEDFNSNGNSE